MPHWLLLRVCCIYSFSVAARVYLVSFVQVALACHLRVASIKGSLGLPEVLIGLLPGAGGTQRLPRLVKAEMALGMITTGKMVSAGKKTETERLPEI